MLLICQKRVGGSAYWRIGVSGDAFSRRVARSYHSYRLGH